jgi:hypothetical protein
VVVVAEVVVCVVCTGVAGVVNTVVDAVVVTLVVVVEVVNANGVVEDVAAVVITAGGFTFVKVTVPIASVAGKYLVTSSGIGPKLTTAFERSPVISYVPTGLPDGKTSVTFMLALAVCPVLVGKEES